MVGTDMLTMPEEVKIYSCFTLHSFIYINDDMQHFYSVYISSSYFRSTLGVWAILVIHTCDNFGWYKCFS